MTAEQVAQAVLGRVTRIIRTGLEPIEVIAKPVATDQIKKISES